MNTYIHTYSSTCIVVVVVVIIIMMIIVIIIIAFKKIRRKCTLWKKKIRFNFTA